MHKMMIKPLQQINKFQQEVGFEVPAFNPPDISALNVELRGNYCTLQPLTGAHASDLFDAFGKDDGRMWTYLSYGPFHSYEEFNADYVRKFSGCDDPKMFAIVRSGKAIGCAAFLRIQPFAGSIEIGHLAFSPELQKSTAATEALFLMINQCFKLGFRRCEWKCDALNKPSANAARRLGFKFEGTFRQAMVYKGRNRNTSWFSIIDEEWPDYCKKLQEWLDPQNFDVDGCQINKLNIASMNRIQ